jgi:hypothetical protein
VSRSEARAPKAQGLRLLNHASQLLAFYGGDGTDDRGRTLAEIWAWDDEQLEYVHDYIQWLFPLAESSMFNASAPLVTADDVEQFRGKPDLRHNLRKSFQRILTPNNHNFLRLTRIMKSTTLLGLPSYAQALLACLEDLYAGEAGATIGPRTMRYWRQALQGSSRRS